MIHSVPAPLQSTMWNDIILASRSLPTKMAADCIPGRFSQETVIKMNLWMSTLLDLLYLMRPVCCSGLDTCGPPRLEKHVHHLMSSLLGLGRTLWCFPAKERLHFFLLCWPLSSFELLHLNLGRRHDRVRKKWVLRLCAERLLIPALENPLSGLELSIETWCRCCLPHQCASRHLSPSSGPHLSTSRRRPFYLFCRNSKPHCSKVSSRPQSATFYSCVCLHRAPFRACFTEVGQDFVTRCVVSKSRTTSDGLTSLYFWRK